MNKKEKRKFNKRPAIFLDRDGTINYDKGYTYKFSEFKFRPYIIKGLKYLTKKGYFFFIRSFIFSFNISKSQQIG